MSNEIKEILEDSINCNYELHTSEKKKLLDCITNLQEENERLNKVIISFYKELESLYNHLTKKDLNYKSRIDKAINILELSSQNKSVCTRPETDTIQSVLNILNGGDE